MKKLLLVLVLIMLQFTVQAQHYQSIFGKQSTSWEIAANNLWGWGQCIILVQKDTVVNGLFYKKVVSPGAGFRAGLFDGGLLREDTIAGKVWYKKLYSYYLPSYNIGDDTIEVLLFDYSLSPGDTFDIAGAGYRMSGPGSYPDSFNVVKRVYYQNNRKHIEFKGPTLERFAMIEGIGGAFGVIWKKYHGILTYQYLLCSYKDGVKTSYTNTAFQGRCAITGISEEEPEDKIVVYPNPAQDRLFIKMASGGK